MRRVLVLAAAAALLAVPAAHANGDPASDVLLTQKVYFPLDAPLPNSDREALQKTVDEANARGYPIRVALIPFTSDLGTAVSLWRHPQDYSKFLGSELAFVYRNRLLVVQPSGFGFYNQKQPVAKERRVLAKVPVGKTPAELAQSATRRCGPSPPPTGVTLPEVSRRRAPRPRDRLIIAVSGLLDPADHLRPGRRLRRGRSNARSPNSDSHRASEAEMPRDDHPLHLVGALADLEDLLVAVEPGDRRLLHEPVPAVDLQRRVRRAV